MNYKKVLFFTTIVLIILLSLSLLYNTNFIKRSFGKAVTQTSSSVKIEGELPPPPPVVPISDTGKHPKANFTVNPSFIKISLKPGETKTEIVEVTNTGQTSPHIDIITGFLNKFIEVSEDSFSLKPGETKSINLGISTRENELPGVYSGRILVRGGGLTRIIYVIIEVKEKTPLLDITTEVTSKKVKPNEDVEANINILNLGDLEQMNITLYYALKDFDGDILAFQEENITLVNELNLVKNLKMPNEYSCVNYVFYAEATYKNISAASADIFTVLCEQIEILAPPPINWSLIIIILIAIMICLLFIVYLIIKERKTIESTAPVPSGEKTKEPENKLTLNEQIHKETKPVTEEHLCRKCHTKLKGKKQFCHKCGTEYKAP